MTGYAIGYLYIAHRHKPMTHTVHLLNALQNSNRHIRMNIISENVKVTISAFHTHDYNVLVLFKHAKAPLTAQQNDTTSRRQLRRL